MMLPPGSPPPPEGGARPNPATGEPHIWVGPPKRRAEEGARPARGASPVGWIIFSLIMGGAIGGTCSTCLTGAAVQREEVIPGGSEHVGVVELFGPIADSAEIVRQIRDFARRDDLEGIVIRIDSPGGAVAPSQEIYEALRFAARTKPVVASMGSVAASGGFWSALGADWIFASPGTITGSIGVLSQTPDLRGLADLLRIRMRTFTSGPLKDAGNPFREMTPEDEELFMSLINDIYGQFVGVVSERRKMDLSSVKKIADGRIMTGRAALEAGLIDQLGGLHDAARKVVALAQRRQAEKEGKEVVTATAAEEGEPPQDPTLIYPRKPFPGLLRMLRDSAESAISAGLAEGVDRAASRAQERLSRDPGSLELR